MRLNQQLHQNPAAPALALPDSVMRNAAAVRLARDAQVVAGSMPSLPQQATRARHAIEAEEVLFGPFSLFVTLAPNERTTWSFVAYLRATGRQAPAGEPPVSVESLVAENPAAAAWNYRRFFRILCVLLGFDLRTKTSVNGGGILGTVEAISGVTENQARSRLHGHFLLLARELTCSSCSTPLAPARPPSRLRARRVS